MLYNKEIILNTQIKSYKIDITQIEYCKSENSYTAIYLRNNSQILISKVLKELLILLPEEIFLRCHRSYAVNIKYIYSYDKMSRCIVLKSGKEIPVSYRKVVIVKQRVFISGIED